MNPTLYDLLLVALSSLISWFFTHRYYLKSLSAQDDEASKQINELSCILNKISPNDKTALKNTYIEGAVETWKKKGQPIDYINSITDISNDLKAEIFHSAALRHKGREPKHNPFLSKE